MKARISTDGRASTAGFTLLELLVACAIMGIAVAGLLSGLAGSMRNAARLADHDRAVLLARSKMDELLLEPRLPRNVVMQGAIDRTALGGKEGGWRARIELFEAPPNAGAQSRVLDRVQVEIWWMNGKQRHSFDLEGYRQNLLAPPPMP